jgi:inosine-uridine nucleoside N-ribohydrolase
MCGGALAIGMLARPSFGSVDHSLSVPPGSTGRKVIIDPDPGVDDAYALLLAMRSPELQIMAITPVAGNVPLTFTLPNARRLVEIAGRTDIPVAGGASEPLTRKLVTAAYAHGENGLAGVDFDPPKLQAVKEPAAVLISRLVRENPGEITLIGIGPLTNIALAIRQDAEMAQMIPGIVLMGGSLSGCNVTPAAEFNFYVDPEAARIVFDSGIPITMVGLDVTRKVELKEQHIQELRSSGDKVADAAAAIAQATMDMYRKQGGSGGPHMHDPLAVSSLILPDVMQYEDYRIEIETAGEITAGESVGWKSGPIYLSAPERSAMVNQTVDDKKSKPNARVATGVNPENFFDLLISRLSGSK